MTGNGQEDTRLIDIEKVIAQKNPKLLKRLPGFAIRYIRRIVHEAEINEFYKVAKDAYGLDFVDKIIEYFKLKYKVWGKENVPASGRFIFAANHSLGGIDGVIFIHLVGHLLGENKSLINDLLMNLKNMRELFIGVNKHGQRPRADIEALEKTLASDAQLLIFPAGLVSRRKKGQIRDVAWRKTFITKSVEYQRDIIPVHTDGQLSNFFYNFANLRKFLGIKANLEMFYLADETFKKMDTELNVTIGKPISYQTFDCSLSHWDWAQQVKEYVYRMGESGNTNLEFEKI